MIELEQQNPTRTAEIQRWTHTSGLEHTADELAVEEPLEVRVRGRAISVTMRTPGHDDELACGFLLSEGLIRTRADIDRVEPCVRAADGNIINVFLSPGVDVDFTKLTRYVFASSSCGLCGRASIDAVHGCFPPIISGMQIEAELLNALPERLAAAQPGFGRTGGLHAAALFDLNGALLIAREDVGRHNAVDKVLGRALLDGLIPLADRVLLVSGRVSFEIVQKALSAGIPLIAGVSAPTSLAVELARDSGQTLAGFVRPGRLNLYAHGRRVVGRLGYNDAR